MPDSSTPTYSTATSSRHEQLMPLAWVPARLGLGIYLSGVNDLAWKGEPDIQAWLQDSRLNIGRAIPGIETILQCLRDH